MATDGHPRRLRSQAWFDDPDDLDSTVLAIERFGNYGLSREELQAGRPIIGIAQSGSDLSPCNRHHLQLADRVREGIREAGGIAFEFPTHPIQESCRRPAAALDRNLSYLGLVEVLHGFPLDGVVLTTGCDKTTPAGLMAAATVDVPAIVLSGGPMLNGWYEGRRIGSGTILFEARKRFVAGEIDEDEYWAVVAASAPSIGHCNTMGTASTMNALAEGLGMSLPGCAAIPAPYQARPRMAYETGLRIVGMVREDLRPSQVMTRAAFENAIVLNSAIGGSTNAPIHLTALAQHVGVPLDLEDWQDVGYAIPRLVNLQPAGEYLGEELHRSGGIPAVLGELAAAGLLPHPDAVTVSGRSIGDGCHDARSRDHDVITPVDAATTRADGLLVLRGNFFDSAVMKTSVISDAFRARYLSDPDDPEAFIGTAIVFDGPEDYLARIEDPDLGAGPDSILVMRGAGAIGYPGSGEVVSMRPPSALIEQGVRSLPCLGDGRQSGTSESPSILHVSPEAAAGGLIGCLRSGDRIRVDLRARRVDVELDEAELETRRAALAAEGGYAYPASQTPWQELHRQNASQLEDGMVLRCAVGFQQVDRARGLPRINL